MELRILTKFDFLKHVLCLLEMTVLTQPTNPPCIRAWVRWTQQWL